MARAWGPDHITPSKWLSLSVCHPVSTGAVPQEKFRCWKAKGSGGVGMPNCPRRSQCALGRHPRWPAWDWTVIVPHLGTAGLRPGLGPAADRGSNARCVLPGSKQPSDVLKTVKTGPSAWPNRKQTSTDLCLMLISLPEARQPSIGVWDWPGSRGQWPNLGGRLPGSGRSSVLPRGLSPCPGASSLEPDAIAGVAVLS